MPGGSTERTVFAFGAGLAALSLLTLGAGLAGALSRSLLSGVIIAAAVIESVLRFGIFGCSNQATTPPLPPLTKGGRTVRRQWLVLIPCVPFVLAMLLGSMLPSVDFDVNEYHFEGPKEFYQAGRITFLEHNVYTSFPFGTEMLTLLAMVLRGDWYRGALAGKCVLMSFAPLTALGLFAAGRRWFGTTAGLCAAFLYLATPWTHRISTIAYAEGGLSFFLLATLLAVMIALDGRRDGTGAPGSQVRHYLLAGVMAGSAMSCKYPALVSVVIPAGAALCWLAWRTSNPPRSRWAAPLEFVCGVFLIMGPWLTKNAAETGNPVYPLAYSVFGGRDWDPAVDVRWSKAHRPDDYSAASLIGMALDVSIRNDWVNPLLFALAPLGLFAMRMHRRVAGIWLYIGWLFFSCWLFTHRIDRFWVPMLPVVALAAGAGAAWWWSITTFPARIVGVAVLAAISLFNLATVTRTQLGGYNDFLRNLDEAEEFVARKVSPELAYLHEKLPSGSKVLSVGDAAVFEARFPIVYNTVFDRSIVEDWMAARPGDAAATAGLRDAAGIREKLRAEGITHIYVSWREILRYRSPGNYGYTEFVTPERFAELERLGILGPAWSIPEAIVDLGDVDAGRLASLETWAQALVTRRSGRASYVTFQVFPVNLD
ncbi:MAG: glycosyltransferase family 39 protein [Planctomycetia bacterium]|nr:glycosyltransferase family 39 protein [Planctomycetia bacterium]